VSAVAGEGRALVYRGPGELRVEPWEPPAPGPGDALVRVEACGICGTDLKIWSGSHGDYPDGTVRVPGHEIVGTVVAAGPDTGLEAGQRVFVAPNIGCGRCEQCRAGRSNLCPDGECFGLTRDGGFATHVVAGADVIAQGNLLPLPDDADPAATSLVEPLACVLRGQRPCRIGPGDVVLIMGAGPIGILHLLAARTRGPRRIVVSEPSADRRDQAAALGADLVVDPAATPLRDVFGDGGPDVVLVAAPAPAAQVEALEVAAPGGRINFFAGLPRGTTVELDTNLVHYKELVVTGTTSCTADDCREALELTLGGAVSTAPLVTARHPLEDAAAAFAAARSGTALKVVIEP
jgi:2-desacetyl-2-hydroxyethyl bacteriochlorophyllide A dehydrogenase